MLRERERLEAVFDRRMDERGPDVLEWAQRWIAVGHTTRVTRPWTAKECGEFLQLTECPARLGN